MSDPDSLLVTFQTQLSDVMENVVKSAMFEVTRLVEDVLLVEVKRRNHEVESLRMRLQWTESKFSEEGAKDGGKTGKCVRGAVELSTEAGEEPANDQQDGMLRVCVVKKEVDSVERWISRCREGVSSQAEEEAEHPPANRSCESDSQASEKEDVIPVDVKKEGLEKPSCSSVHLGQWSCTHKDKAEPESDDSTGIGEAQPTQAEVANDKSLRNVNKDDVQIHSSYEFAENQQETRHTTDQSHVSSLERDTKWTGLTVTLAGLRQNQRLEAEKERDHNKTKVSQKRTKPEQSNTTRVSSPSPKLRLQHSDGLGVTIKEEVIIDSDGCEENEHREKKSPLVTPSLMGPTKQHRASSEARKPSHVHHKAPFQEGMKLHSRAGAGLRLQAVSQHLHRPVRKLPHTLPSSALSLAQAVNNLNRMPSTSKATPTSLTVQRVQLGDKQTSQLNRSGAPWVSIKAQHHSAHANPTPHSDSLLHAGPRHLLRCGQCGKCFPHPSNLKAHLQTHTGERPFCCSLCGRSFTKLSNLKAHRRVHTGERPYCCLACGKRFTQKCNLKRHQRIHLDV